VFRRNVSRSQRNLQRFSSEPHYRRVDSLKVLFVTPHIFAGGAEKALLNLAFHLNSMDCQTSIATLSLDLTKLPSYLAKLNFILPAKPIEQPIMDNAEKVFTSMLRQVTAFVKIVRRFSGQFDIVCACNFPTYWATYFARTGKPIVWLSSEVLGPYNQTKDIYDRSLFFRLALQLAITLDKHIVSTVSEPIITCSGLNKRLLKERYGRDAVVLNTGVDYDFFKKNPCETKEQLRLDGDPILLHVGALIQRKNQILSIRALKALKPKLPSAKLVLVGEGPWKPILQQETQKLGLEGEVIFAGSISEDQLRSYYYACNINLFPVKDQTWGLVPFEAIVAGKPSIVAEGAGAAEVMGKCRIAFLIKLDVQELADAVLFSLKNPEINQDMVSRGQAYVRDNLTWEKYARDMYQVFEIVLCSSRTKLYDKKPKT
jgi:glycosyltransferase involved in cell wall biosynthesis